MIWRQRLDFCVTYQEMGPNGRAPLGSEADEQSAFFRWLAFAANGDRRLELFYHIPNGGSRNRAEAARLKAQGVRAGVPDLCLPVACGGYHGLYIEMKVGNNIATKEQKQWLRALREQGHYTAVCYGWQAARAAVNDYLDAGRGTDVLERRSKTGTERL